MTNQKTKTYDIRERALEFAAHVAHFVSSLPKNQATLEYGRQLIRSSASIGANLEEADGTLSKKDFVNKVAIARREARESRYWVQLIRKAGLVSDIRLRSEAQWLLGEAREILLILSAIVQKTQAKLRIP